MNFSVQLPLNVVSFGQVSVALLREFWSLGLQPCIFPIGPVELNSQYIEQDFGQWIQSGINKALFKHSRTNPLFKLWHLNDAWHSLSHKQLLYSFYELDSPTEAELNIVRNIDKVLFSSSEATQHFKDSGANNVDFAPLGFDRFNFHTKERPQYLDNRVVFNLVGKLERRKHHAKVIKAWVSKYGNNKDYFLQCALWNPFFKPEELEFYYNQILEGKKYFNVEFYPFFGNNKDYNSFLNSADIVIGASGGEGWGLPEFHSVALGKHAVIHNCSGYKDWANASNACLVEPAGKVEAYDGKFFVKGIPFNQGNIYYFDDDKFLTACDEAVNRYRKSNVNWEGLKLQVDFSYAKLAQNIIKNLETI